MERKSKVLLTARWALQLVAAFILGQTLYFKFTAASESVYIFETLGMEPWGRLGTGLVELIAVVLLLAPRWSWAGALLGLGVMAGAILSHLTVLGVEVQGDGGFLFSLAITVSLCCAALVYLNRKDILHRVGSIRRFLGSDKIAKP